MRERELKATVKNLQRKLNVARQHLQHHVTKRELPKLKKQYEGKFFKYRNNYSCAETESDYWFLYRKVMKVVDWRSVDVIQFEMDKYKKISIERQETYIENLGVEISEKEYKAAAQGMKINCIAALEM